MGAGKVRGCGHRCLDFQLTGRVGREQAHKKAGCPAPLVAVFLKGGGGLLHVGFQVGNLGFLDSALSLLKMLLLKQKEFGTKNPALARFHWCYPQPSLCTNKSLISKLLPQKKIGNSTALVPGSKVKLLVSPEVQDKKELAEPLMTQPQGIVEQGF